jgi:D-alanine-D-alanine ligase-like ATP-grasp enzyme
MLQHDEQYTVPDACSTAGRTLCILALMKAKKRKTPTPLLGTLFAKIARRAGAKVLVEPRWGIVGQIRFTNGRNRYFRYSTVDLNPVGASEIAKDKDYANFFLASMGYPTIPGKTFFSKEWAAAIGSREDIDAAYRYAKKIGFPVFVKPNSGSQGRNAAKVETKRELVRALRAVFKHDSVALVQKVVTGNDYRIVVLDGKVICAYERLPLSIVGDGRTSIRGLLRKKQESFIASSRDTRLKMDDPRYAEVLARSGLSLASVPEKGVRIPLLDNANLSSGGESVDVTSRMHQGWKKIAANITRDMGLRMCGVDLMLAGSITGAPGPYVVIEINAAPGLDHYASSGKKQQRIVESLYTEVLKSLAR